MPDLTGEGATDGSPPPFGDIRPDNQYRALRQRTFCLVLQVNGSGGKFLSLFVSYYRGFTEESRYQSNLIIDSNTREIRSMAQQSLLKYNYGCRRTW